MISPAVRARVAVGGRRGHVRAGDLCAGDGGAGADTWPTSDAGGSAPSRVNCRASQSHLPSALVLGNAEGDLGCYRTTPAWLAMASSASFQSRENSALSKPGIKHLVQALR